MIKLLRLTTAYPSYLRHFYRKNWRLRNAPHAVQQDRLNRDAFGWADFWAVALAPLGYTAWDIVTNAVPLQSAWARENGLSPRTPGRQLEVAAAQVRSFRPDVMFLDDPGTFAADWIRQLRAECPSIRLVLGWCGAPFDDGRVFAAYDVVLSCIPELVQLFRERGHKSFHLNHAFDPRVAERCAALRRDIDLSFVGQLTAGRQAHVERLAILRELSGQARVRIHSPQAWSLSHLSEGALVNALKNLVRIPWYDTFWKLRAAGLPVHRVPFFRRPMIWPSRPSLPEIAPSPIPGMRRAVYGMEMFRVLGRSRIAFNSHIDISRDSASNMRLFEATGMGACLITDWKANLGELFKPDEEVVAYRNAGECIDKVKWLLDHPDRRQAIARAGRERTFAGHTFKHRAPVLDEIIRGQL